MAKDLSGAQVGMAPTNSINNPRPDNMRGRNIFPQTHCHPTTDRYGDISPFFWTKAERGDVQNLNTHHTIQTYTLSSPIVDEVTLLKSFVKVPMQAIYPINWEKMFTIPTHGDDVPSDTRALLDVYRLVNNLVNTISSTAPYYIIVKSFVLLEYIASDGALFPRFNYHLNYLFDHKEGTSTYIAQTIDQIADQFFWEQILTFGLSNPLIGDDDVRYYVRNSPQQVNSSTSKYVSKRRFIEMIRSNDYSFSDSWIDSPFTFDISFNSGYSYDDQDGFINIEPIISYQLACAQFATNDFVDYIYSAQLYRENLRSIVYGIFGTPSFTFNGTVFLYDVFSCRYFDEVMDYLNFSDYDDIIFSSCLDFFLNIFEYQKSLRYGDYFTGAKPRPLAVGEYSAEVNNNAVSAIDITKSIQMQRLLNRVNMVGRKLSDYLSGIFGGSLPEAPKDVPIFLAHQRFDVRSNVTENTGDIQFDSSKPNTMTSNLYSSQSKHSFEIQIDEPCYIIGMNYYEVPRIYGRTMDRFAFHHDRYDDFIPEMQYIGDQDIKQCELDSTLTQVPFGYALRYMEYKQRYSYASGGFLRYLPSWAMITDNTDGNPPVNNIDPNYIRSSSSEFDRFYKSLTGYSLASYFHFIVKHVNICEPVRQMEYTPEILK